MTSSGWRLEEVDGVRLARCEAVEAVAGLAHAFSTRIAFGRSDFDLGPSPGDSNNPSIRTKAFLRAAGLGTAPPALLRQVHGGLIVNAGDASIVPQAADGVIRVARHGAASPVPAVRTADCVAVLVVDRKATAVAALHAGWRGAASGIAAAAVARFASEGVDPGDLVVVLGPAILGCCYEVGEEVVASLEPACGDRSGYVGRSADGALSVDLHAALRQQLTAAAVSTASIHTAPWCTRCRTDLYFSFRGEGAGCGRHMAVVGPAAGP